MLRKLLWGLGILGVIGAMMAYYASTKVLAPNVPAELDLRDNTLNHMPQVSFTFDDGITQNLASYEFSDWNQMILTALKEAGLTSVFFVAGKNKLDDKGRYLLQSWSCSLIVGAIIFILKVRAK